MLNRKPLAAAERYLYVLLACSGVSAALTLTSCAPPPIRPTSLAAATDPSVRTVLAEWSDLEAALEVAVRHAEVAVVGRELGEGRMVFQLQSVAAEPGHLIATAPRAGEGESVPIRLETRIGLFGNPAREEALLRAVAARLEQLRGREWAPVR